METTRDVDDVGEFPEENEIENQEELLSQTINAHSPETQVKKKKSLLSEVLVNGLLKNINDKVNSSRYILFQISFDKLYSSGL